LRSGFLFITLALACFVLSPDAQAILPAPTPDGAYPNWNTVEGSGALFNVTTGGFNTAIGGNALNEDRIGSSNTAVGAFALAGNSQGSQNVAVGHGALRNNLNTSGNTATGYQALYDNTGGGGNTAMGFKALYQNTTGLLNTATGTQALWNNTTGHDNTAAGEDALYSNTTGYGNVGIGFSALFSNTTGVDNVACGGIALPDNTTGSFNIAIGVGALNNNTTGSNNIALGEAGLGVMTADNVICIGNELGVVPDVSNTCFIGNIRGVTTQNNDAIPVLVDSRGQLGTVSSSRRFKTDIKAIDKASESILSLKPVSFRYKVHTDMTPQFGLIAEEVAEVNPELVIYDPDGKPYTVRYDAVNAMLLNEFLKEHRKVEKQDTITSQLESMVAKQEATVAKQEATIARQQKEIEALTVGLQKVTDQLALSIPALRTVLNHR